ncbi:hypothetical protein MJH54_29425, partial [Salmonella enterica subsp. enterica serovar Montevideo]|nr:hypothetical protein [Salmonella enterica subsp. enterica serovar Montevideo]
PRPPKGASEEFISTLRKFDRQALHATMLRLYHPVSGIEMEWHELFADIPEALENTVEIAKRCNVTVRLGEYFLPQFPTGDMTTE